MKVARVQQLTTYKESLKDSYLIFPQKPWKPESSGVRYVKSWGGGQKTQPRILYLAKLSSKTEGEIKIFPDKQNLTEFITSRPSLQDMLKGVLQV